MICFIPAVANAQHSLLHLYSDQTLLILGSQDSRRGLGFAYQFVKPEKRFDFRQVRAEMVYEVYAHRSWGGRKGRVRNTQNNFGIAGLARYEQGKPGKSRSFWEAGWGLQLVDRTSQDIDTRLNSTPMIGAGWIHSQGGNETYYSLRYFHISNAGTKGSNQGQNWLQLMVGLRF